jgi:hypothetical protein
MPQGTPLIDWNPRVGSTGDDRFRWPPNVPFRIGTPKASFADPRVPLLSEVQGASGWQQVVAYLLWFNSGYKVGYQSRPGQQATIQPVPLLEDRIESLSNMIDGIAPYWTGYDPNLLYAHLSCSTRFLFPDNTTPWRDGVLSSESPIPPGNHLGRLRASIGDYHPIRPYVKTANTIFKIRELISRATEGPSAGVYGNIGGDCVRSMLLRYRESRATSGYAWSFYPPNKSIQASAYITGNTFPPPTSTVGGGTGTGVFNCPVGQSLWSGAYTYRTDRAYLHFFVPYASGLSTGQLRIRIRMLRKPPLYTTYQTKLENIYFFDSGTYVGAQETDTPASPMPWLSGTPLGSFDLNTIAYTLPSYTTAGLEEWDVVIPLPACSSLSALGTKRTIVVASHSDLNNIPPVSALNDDRCFLVTDNFRGPTFQLILFTA